MGLLSKVKSTKTEKVEDRVGGFQVHPTDVYDALLERVYAYKTDGGTLAVVVEAEIYPNPDSDETKRYSQTFYVTNGDGENFYTDGQGKKRLNSSWVIIDSLAVLATKGEAGLAELDTEDITIKLKRDGKEVNEDVESFFELEGLECKLAIQHVNKPKTQKVDGKWVELEGEFSDSNEVNHVFNDEGFTALEYEAELAKPEFMEKWLKQWKGKTRTVKPKAKEATTRTGGTGRSGAGARTPSRSSGRASRFERK